MTALTPCQKCKAERADALARIGDGLKRVAELEEELRLARHTIASLALQVAEHERGAEAYASKSVKEVARWMKRYDDLVGLLGRTVAYAGAECFTDAIGEEIRAVLNPPGVGPALPAVYIPEDT